MESLATSVMKDLESESPETDVAPSTELTAVLMEAMPCSQVTSGV
jgi:hypothetical protein